MKQYFLKLPLALTAVLILSSCAKEFQTYPVQIVEGTAITKIPADTPTTSLDSKLLFCSPLSFTGITWNQSLTLTERRSLAIALSISGGFEGGDGWSNLTNDFDGMGLSAGLLNQALGTGSLQPLLAEMAYQQEVEFSNSFSSSRRKSILAMLETWKKDTSWRPRNLSLHLAEASDRDAFITEMGSDSEIQAEAISPAAQSAQWARSTLYSSDGSFVPAWKKELQTLLVRPTYISLQVETARRYHMKAMEYLQRIGIVELRAYLLMFDIVTQNGSIKESRFLEWENRVKAQKLTTVTSKLKALVDIRLLDTKPEWRADVKSRKYTLIDGTGVVHGKKLNLPKSYCYSSTDPVK